jgi:hypothetical protein
LADDLLTASEADWVMRSAGMTIACETLRRRALRCWRALFDAATRASHFALGGRFECCDAATISAFEIPAEDRRPVAMLAYLSDTWQEGNAYQAYWGLFSGSAGVQPNRERGLGCRSVA